MLKVLAVVASIGFATSAFAGQQKLEIRGCSFTTQQYFKGQTPVSGSWSQGFDVEKRQGWGLPTTKQSEVFGESYIGQADLDKDGTKLEVVVSSDGSQKLTVKASIKKVSGDKVEVFAIGTGSGQATIFESGSRVLAGVEIQNPLVSSILESDKSVRSPIDSALFPKNTMVFAGATVYCHADLK